MKQRKRLRIATSKAKMRSTVRKVAIPLHRLNEPVSLYDARTNLTKEQAEQINRLVAQERIADDDPEYLAARMHARGLEVPSELLQKAREQMLSRQSTSILGMLAHSVAIQKKIGMVVNG
jgi:hypothetical protein